MSTPKIAVYGAGGLGKEIRALIDDQSLGFAGYIDDHSNTQPAADINSVRDVVVAIAKPHIRRGIVSKISNRSFPFKSLIDPSVRVRSSVKMGRGCIICPGVQLTVDIEMGSFVIINLNASVGHDVKMGDFVSIMPGACISGNVKIADDVFIGSAAVILQGLSIGKGAVIGAGAVVTKDIAPGLVVVGVPARPLKK